ncbi:hypothetical protein L484_017842 [Morus notabilis]|uniref:Uncharacterized protein n=1 Tax=Morus notabilis TaxID=981085 RepID=W9R0F6_9ROSA|nr:uncharacterized protein LOC21400825 [Morus notabilis]EXB50304.1 hypothetical protein L484_017842 [Morus notabilis]
MGNCMRRESSMRWGGEDWGSPAADHGLFPVNKSGGTSKNDIMEIEEDQGLILKHGGEKGFVNATSSYSNYGTSTTSGTEVKIKITKKQLEKLLGKMDVKDMSVQQVLAQLISVSDKYQTQQIRSWRPALQSIPEVD